MIWLSLISHSAASTAITGNPVPAATPPGSPSLISSDAASALPTWLLIALLALVTLIVAAMFTLAAYSLSAPRSTLRNLLGQGRARRPPPAGMVTPHLVQELATSARSGNRTTRTTLAITGFSLLGVVILAMFGLSGQGVRDLRGQISGSLVTLVAAIAGFYFGSRAAQADTASPTAPGSPPTLGPDPDNPPFTVGRNGAYNPVLTGIPPPVVSLSGGTLPDGLRLNASTGTITGTPAAGMAGDHDLTLTASNGIAPDAQLTVRLMVMAAP